MAEPDDLFARLVATLREPVRIDPGLTGRVMAEIERTEAADRLPLAWWRRRWTIRLSPLGGLALAAGLAGLVLVSGRLARTAPGAGEESPAAAEPSGSTRLTQFVLLAPKAESVWVVGDFNDWSLSATPLTQAGGDGLWWVTVPLRPGRYRYSFVVNGTTWLRDPDAPAVEDEFGRPNSVVTIGGA